MCFSYLRSFFSLSVLINKSIEMYLLKFRIFYDIDWFLLTAHTYYMYQPLSAIGSYMYERETNDNSAREIDYQPEHPCNKLRLNISPLRLLGTRTQENLYIGKHKIMSYITIRIQSQCQENLSRYCGPLPRKNKCQKYIYM
jgi:hypothetical protein